MTKRTSGLSTRLPASSQIPFSSPSTACTHRCSSLSAQRTSCMQHDPLLSSSSSSLHAALAMDSAMSDQQQSPPPTDNDNESPISTGGGSTTLRPAKRRRKNAGDEDGGSSEPRRLRRSHEACARCRGKKIKASPVMQYYPSATSMLSPYFPIHALTLVRHVLLYFFLIFFSATVRFKTSSLYCLRHRWFTLPTRRQA